MPSLEVNRECFFCGNWAASDSLVESVSRSKTSRLLPVRSGAGSMLVAVVAPLLNVLPWLLCVSQTFLDFEQWQASENKQIKVCLLTGEANTIIEKGGRWAKF